MLLSPHLYPIGGVETISICYIMIHNSAKTVIILTLQTVIKLFIRFCIIVFEMKLRNGMEIFPSTLSQFVCQGTPNFKSYPVCYCNIYFLCKNMIHHLVKLLYHGSIVCVRVSFLFSVLGHPRNFSNN